MDIKKIEVRVENRTRQVLKIHISPGTCFIASGRHQNMAARVEKRFSLQELDVYSGSLSAVCVNAKKPIPSDRDSFSSVARSPADLTRFLARSARENPMVVQAGVWALTDRYTAAQIQARLRRGASSAISNKHIKKAREILHELGIAHTL